MALLEEVERRQVVLANVLADVVEERRSRLVSYALNLREDLAYGVVGELLDLLAQPGRILATAFASEVGARRVCWRVVAKGPLQLAIVCGTQTQGPKFVASAHRLRTTVKARCGP